MPQPALHAFTRRRHWFWLAVGLVVLGGILNTFFLWHHSAIQLSEDESHYWEWSLPQHLDYGYYSKPPGIAWVIWGAVRAGDAMGLTGDGSGPALMPVIRMPAILFGILSGLLSLLLARRIFRDDTAALAVTALSAGVPMFAVGSLLITIDSPMYLCWAATVYCLWRAVENAVPNKKQHPRNNPPIRPPGPANACVVAASAPTGWLWLAGLCCALGMLFKPVLIAIPLCALVAAALDQPIRRAFFRWSAAGALALVALSQVPVVLWNAHHGWVTFRHIATQGGLTGAGTQSGTNMWAWAKRLGEYVGGQAGGMGGIMFALLVIAVATVWLRVKNAKPSKETAAGAADQHTLIAWKFLLAFTVPLWAFYCLLSLWKDTEINWPAASYFTGMILLAGVVVEGWNAIDPRRRRGWRLWTTIAVVWGILLTSGLMNAQRLYPAIGTRLGNNYQNPAYFKALIHPRKWDPSAVKLRGFQERAQDVQTLRNQLATETHADPLIITNRYDTSSSLSFYMPGHPFVFCIMSSVGRQSQYDLWPGVNEWVAGQLKYAGRPALIIGNFDQTQEDRVLRPAFDTLDGPFSLPVWYNGVVLQVVRYYRGYGFRGLPETKTGEF